MDITRRKLIGGAAALLAPVGSSAVARENADTSLAALARSRGLLFGAAAVSRDLSRDSALADIYAKETGIIVPDLELKWGRVEPKEGVYDFAGADFLKRFSDKHGKTFRGHNLVWEESNPSWLTLTINKDNAERLLVQHIRHVAGRYKGQMHSWDVVNEPIWPDHHQPGGLRDGPWLRTLGPRYIDIAFHAAKETDPSAILVMNEAATESNESHALRRRDDFVNLLDRLKRDGVPIEAVGLECHLTTTTPFDESDFQRYLEALAERGYRILISEIDVADLEDPSDTKTRDQNVSVMYHRVLSTAVQNRNLIAILCWELADKYSWLRDPALPERRMRTDRSPQRPLLYDDALQKKPAYWAIADALERSPAHT